MKAISATFELEEQRQIFAWAAEKIRSEFKENSWQAFWKTAVENKPVEQVARELEISKGAVYIARSRVMAKFKNKVQQFSSLDNENITGPFQERNVR